MNIFEITDFREIVLSTYRIKPDHREYQFADAKNQLVGILDLKINSSGKIEGKLKVAKEEVFIHFDRKKYSCAAIHSQKEFLICATKTKYKIPVEWSFNVNNDNIGRVQINPLSNNIYKKGVLGDQEITFKVGSSHGKMKDLILFPFRLFGITTRKKIDSDFVIDRENDNKNLNNRDLENLFILSILLRFLIFQSDSFID